jgi:parvulin-like peptidyl-prolyl isomerase
MKRTVFFTVLCFLAAVSGFTQADLQPAAIVNLIRTEPITVRQLRSEVERLQAANNGRVLTQAERLQVLDLMINERLALQAAERDRIFVSENEITQSLRNNLAQQIGRQPTDAEFTQAIAQAIRENGTTEQALREQARKQLIVEKYLRARKGDMLNSVRPPTEEEIVAEFNLLRGDLVRPETIRLSMIRIPYGPDSASRTRARELANRLIQEIGSNPSKFDEVSARSVAPNSGYQAGDMGFLPRNQEARNAVGQDFMNVAFSLRQGEVSRLIEGVQGFEIIKVTENYSVASLQLDDIFQLGTRITVRDYIGQALFAQRWQATLAQASQELVTELRAGSSFQIFNNTLNW